MITRRNLLVGSAAVLGSVSMGTGVAAAAAGRPLGLAATLPLGAVSGFRLPGGLVCPVPYMSRAAWGADESWRFTNGAEDWPPEHFPVQALTVHHTGFAASADAAETVRTIYRQQALTSARGGIQGWGDIGYNLLIDANGVVYEGRYSGSSYPVFGPSGSLMTTAAHVLYYNTGNIGVCLLGYLNDSPPTQAAQDSLVTVLAYLAAVTGVDPLGTVNYYNPVARPDGSHSSASVAGVSGHRNWAATDCPGHALYPLLGGIRQRVADAKPAAPQPSQSTSQGTSTTEPSPSTSQTSSAQPDGSASPTPSTSQTTPQPQLTSDPPPPPAPQNPPPAAGGPRSERGGDEYVAAARTESPSEFPTVAPSPTPTPSPTVDDLASATPSPTPTPTWTSTSTGPAASLAKGSDWGVTAAALGLTLAGGTLGSLGGWWLRRRRSVLRATRADQAPATSPAAPADAEPAPTNAAEASPVDGPAPTVRPPAVDGD